MFEEIKDDNNPFLVKIIYKESDILGYLLYSYIYDRMEIEDILVYEEYRGKKIGNKLMEYLIEKAEKLNALNITLEVNETNYIAINLYKKYGFKEVAIRKNYYDKDNGILMEKKIGGDK